MNLWPYLFLVTILFLNSCGMQMPVTEGLVFSSDDPYGHQHEEILPFIRYGGAITAVSTITGYSQLEDQAVAVHGSQDARFLNRRYMTASGYPGFGFSFGNGRRFALGVTPGVVVAGMHVDATLRTVENFFLTANYNVTHAGTEIILQRPIWERDGGGLSAGAFFRSQNMQFVRSNERWSYGEPDFRIQWYGIRVMGQSPKFRGANLHIRGFLNVGYVRTYDVPLVAVGMAIAID